MMFEENDAYEPIYSYDEVFPALPDSESQPAPQVQSTWSQRMKVSSSVITQVFRVPVEERRYKEIDNQFGGQGEQAKICGDIMQRTGAHIEVNSAKDQSLTILVTGKQDAVMNARREIINALQTQANAMIAIPKEHHRFILGKNGNKLHDLELATATKISVPRPDENSDGIRIVGTKEGIEKARHEIQLCSDEQAKLDFVRLPIPKIYHPFIQGPHNETMNAITNETGARINIPPPCVFKDELTIAGEKEGVAKAKELINSIYEEKKRKCQTVSMEVRKSHHKYVIGPKGNGLHEILATTGVSVEMPQSESPLETITLRGEQDKLGAALTLVYKKANSVADADVVAPSWLHKFIIGRKGANIRKITQDLPKVHVEFQVDQNKIFIVGPPEEVEQARLELENVTKDLLSRLNFAEIEVDPRFHKHIIGKSGANVNRIKEVTGVLINIPSDGQRIIRIEGSAAGVASARQELMDMVKKLENEKSRDLIMEQRFHRSIIGAKGEKIKEIRDRFNQVNINFPDPAVKSDVVTIRGPRDDVEQCYKYLQKLNKELIESNYSIEVVIYKQLHKFIIGKAGATIKKIRDETDTKVELPAEGSNSDTITITGKKANVEEARRRILEIQSTHENITSANMVIPSRLHNAIIGSKGRLIRSITEECGVNILFPAEGSGSDEVTIRGPKEDVEKAKKQLQELANEKQLTSFSEEVHAKPEHHKFLIGRNGANIKKVRDKTGARIIFPTGKDDDRDSIVIMGKKEAVQQARVELETLIKNLDNIIEREIHVDPKYHRHFVARRGQVLRDIAEEYGGVAVSFPRSGNNSSTVVLKGAKDCVEGAVQRINEIVGDLQQQISIEVSIAQRHHRTIMGAKGCKVQGITQEFDVQIKFPDREAREDGVDDEHQNLNGDEVQMNGNVSPHVDNELGDVNFEKPRKNDIIKIMGKAENCEKAKQALLALVPITDEVTVPYDFHRFIIGQKGKDVRELMKEFDVNIVVPPVNQQSDIIRVSGTPTNVELAKQALQNKVEQLEKEKEDRALRTFQLRVEVDPRHHPKIIGRKGAVISKIRQDHEVQIQLSDKGDPDENIITITGYEKNAHAARDAINKIVQELEGMVNEEVSIDHRVHSRLIGARGRSIRKIMDEYKVDIRFPRESDPDPNQVVITGPEEQVVEAKEHLLNLEEEYMQDIKDAEDMRQYTQAPSRQQEDFRPRPENKGFVVKGGPWEQKAPDTTSSAEFPSFGTADVPKPIVWGPRR